MANAKWVQTWHTDGWWELKAGRKTIADVRRVFPRKTKNGYRWEYMVVTKWAVQVNGLPGFGGQVFKTLKAAKATAEGRI